MTELELINDLFKGTRRQGPGSQADTLRALKAMRLDPTKEYHLVDIGCGSGGQTLVLAQNLKGKITGVDLFSGFLSTLNKNAQVLGLGDKVSTLEVSMEDLPFGKAEFDIIWSEGAIYNIGFERGVKKWSQFLKKGGYMALSELIWTTSSRPKDIEDHWMSEYPEVDTSENKIVVLEENGFTLLDHFVLGESSWIDEYYEPLETQLKGFLKRNGNSQLAQKVVSDQVKEIELYRKYKDYFSYGFYIVRKL